MANKRTPPLSSSKSSSARLEFNEHRRSNEPYTGPSSSSTDRINNWGISPNSDLSSRKVNRNSTSHKQETIDLDEFMKNARRPNLIGSSASHQNLSNIVNATKESGYYLIDNEKQIEEQFSKLNEFIKQSKMLKQKLRESPESSREMLDEIDNVCDKLNLEKQRYIEFLYKKHELTSFRDPASGQDSDDESLISSSAEDPSATEFSQISSGNQRPFIEENLGRNSDIDDNRFNNENVALYRKQNRSLRHFEEDKFRNDNFNYEKQKRSQDNNANDVIAKYEPPQEDDNISNPSIDALTKDLEDVIKYRDMLDNALLMARKQEGKSNVKTPKQCQDVHYKKSPNDSCKFNLESNQYASIESTENDLNYVDIKQREQKEISKKNMSEKRLKEELKVLKKKLITSSPKNKAEWMACGDSWATPTAASIDQSRSSDYRKINNARAALLNAEQNMKQMDALTLEAMTNGRLAASPSDSSTPLYESPRDKDYRLMQSNERLGEDNRKDEMIEAKLRRLNNASEKLNRLKELVYMVKADDLMRSNNTDYVGTKNDEKVKKLVPKSKSQGNLYAIKAENCDTDVKTRSKVNSEQKSTSFTENSDGNNYFEELSEQKVILEGLLKERDELLTMKKKMEYLKEDNKLKMNKIKQTIKTEKLYKKKKINNQLTIDEITNGAQVTFQEPIEMVRSNEILYDKMRQQRMLREEVLSQKRELQRFMRLDREPISDQCSFSTKSDLFGGTAPTQATWGDSTNENSEREFPMLYQRDYENSESDEENCYQQVEEEEEEEADSDINRENTSFSLNKQEILHNSLRTSEPINKKCNMNHSTIEVEQLSKNVSQLQIEMSNITEVLIHLMNDKAKPKKKFGRKINSIDKYNERNETAALLRLKEVLANKNINESEFNTLRSSMNAAKEISNKPISNEERNYIPHYYNDEQTDSEINNSMSKKSVDDSDIEIVIKDKNTRLMMKDIKMRVKGDAIYRDENTKVLPLVDSDMDDSIGKETETIAIETIIAKDVQDNVPVQSFSANTSATNKMRRKWKSGPFYYGRSSDSTCGSIRELGTDCQTNRQYTDAKDIDNGYIYSNGYNSNIKSYTSIAAGVTPGTSFASTTASLLSSSQPSSFGTGIVNDELFDSLRESIYSEVATLISQNEDRPYYLIELFRDLQMLTTDLMRQQALYAVQSCIPKLANDLENNDKKYDYSEPVSTSSIATPIEQHENYFADESLGETVIHYNQALQEMRDSQKTSTMEDIKLEEEIMKTDLSSIQKDIVITKYDVNAIIKTIVSSTLDYLSKVERENVNIEDFSDLMTSTIVERLVLFVVEKVPRIEDVADKIRMNMKKFIGKSISECSINIGESLSESLYDELSTCIDNPEDKDRETYYKDNKIFTADDEINDTVKFVACEVKPFKSDEDDDVEDTVDVDVDILDTAVAHDLQNEINGESDDITIDDLPNDLAIKLAEESLETELTNSHLVEIMNPEDILVGEQSLHLPNNIGLSDE